MAPKAPTVTVASHSRPAAARQESHPGCGRRRRRELRNLAGDAGILTTVATTILDSDLDVTTHEFFGVRDGLSAGTWPSRFGLLCDDYVPEPTCHAIRELIASAGSRKRFGRIVASHPLRS